MKSQSRNKAQHALWHSHGHCNNVGLTQWRKIRESVKSPAESFNHAFIAHLIERPRVNACTNSFARSEHSAMATKNALGFSMGILALFHYICLG